MIPEKVLKKDFPNGDSSSGPCIPLTCKPRNEMFPGLIPYTLTEDGGKFILEVTKEFNAELEGMKFD